MPIRSRLKGWDWRGVAVGVVCSVLCLVLLEAAARALVDKPPVFPELYAPHPEAIYLPKPGAEAEHHFGEGFGEAALIHSRINEQGFRGPPCEAPKPADEIRVLCIGDSYTYGWGVEEETAYPAVLEDLLRDAIPGKHVRVLNGGIPGQGPWQARIALKERYLALQPDIVLLQTYTGNDVGDTLMKWTRTLDAYSMESFQFVQVYRARDYWIYRFNESLRNDCRLYYLLERASGHPFALASLYNKCGAVQPVPFKPAMQSAPRPWIAEMCLKEWYPALNEAWAEMQRDIAGIAEDCRTRGIDFGAFNIPWPLDGNIPKVIPPGQVNEYELSKGNELLETCLAQQAAIAIPLAAPMKSLPDARAFVFKNDGHLNAAGNAWLAETVAEAIRPRLSELASPPPMH